MEGCHDLAELSIANYTLLHVVISLIAIASGDHRAVRHVWLASDARHDSAVSPHDDTDERGRIPVSEHRDRARRRFSAISRCVVLAIALLALYAFKMRGAWRWIYAGSAVVALYLNVFVLVVQSFQKIPFLQPLAPTQSEPPFLIAQAVLLAIFVVLGIVALVKFHPERHVAA